MPAPRLDLPRLLAFGAMVLLLGACAAKNVETDYRPNNGGGTGLLIGSISTDDEDSFHGARSIVYFQKEGSDDLANDPGLGDQLLIDVFSDGFLGAPDSDFSDTIGKVFVVELPAGRYAFDHWTIITGTVTVTPRGEIPTVPFEIRAGKATYVGNFHGFLRTGENVFGMTIIPEGLISLGSEIKRDLATIRRLYPNLKEIEVTPALPPPGPWIQGRVSDDVDL